MTTSESDTATTGNAPLRETVGHVDDIAALREHVMHTAWDIGFDSTEAVDAAIVASELLTNALTHGAAPVWIAVQVPSDGVLRLEVGDGGAPLDLPAAEGWPDVTQADGRGLLLCRTLCSSLVVRPLRGGKVVVATITSAPAAPSNGT